jgi:hypothetical protein
VEKPCQATGGSCPGFAREWTIRLCTRGRLFPKRGPEQQSQQKHCLRCSAGGFRTPPRPKRPCRPCSILPTKEGTESFRAADTAP